MRSWVCEKGDQSGQGAEVQVQLSVRSSSGEVSSLDPTYMRIASMCGDTCQCDTLSGCICGESGAVLGEIVGAQQARDGLLLLTVSFWLFAGLDCFITVEDSRGSSFGDFESVVLEVPAAQVSQYAASGEPVPVRMMAVEPVNPLQTKGVRAVLSWGASPSDLDFHIYKDMGEGTTCLTCGEEAAADRVCSQAQPVDYRRKKSFNGVSLDLDDTTSFGPETITWDDAADEGVYHLVVHVFNQRTSLRGSEVQVMVALRSGLVTILPSSEVLESSCGVETCVFSRCCYWWVGTITKEGTSFNFQPANAVIKKPSRC